MENKQIKVLLVDDDRIVGNSITEGLIYLGYDVHYQTSLIAINAIISEFQPNIIILDVEIGDKDGIENSIGIRKSFPNIPIIFISSHVDPSYTERALNNGGILYLKKPVEIKELASYIKRHAIQKIQEIICVGQFRLNLKTRILENNKTNKYQKLNSKECELLCILVENLGCITTRDEIITKIWNGDYSYGQILSNYLVKIRKYLSGDATIQIKTIPREGYILTIDN